MSSRTALIAGAAVAGLAVGAIAVYFIESGAGNGAVAAAPCDNALAAAARTAPLAQGEVAAFRPASEADPLTELAFKAPDGSDITLAAFGGKTTLVNLWATWCGPCRVEMPALDRLQGEIGGDDFQVVAINVDLNAEERARAFFDDIAVENLAFYSDPTSGVFRSLKGRGLAFGLPTTLLVDGDGCRIGVVQGPAAWDSDDAKALIAAATVKG